MDLNIPYVGVLVALVFVVDAHGLQTHSCGLTVHVSSVFRGWLNAGKQPNVSKCDSEPILG